jgi:hypothetical protein
VSPSLLPHVTAARLDVIDTGPVCSNGCAAALSLALRFSYDTCCLPLDGGFVLGCVMLVRAALRRALCLLASLATARALGGKIEGVHGERVRSQSLLTLFGDVARADSSRTWSRLLALAAG